MVTLAGLEDRLRQRLTEAVSRYGVPGAALGISIGDETTVVTTGAASLRTGIPVMRDTLFGIGSVTKVYQAALLLSLGLDIDQPVRRYLPAFRVADADATEAITVRQLLTHSSGLESNHMPDFGWGNDVVRQYVESCASLGQLHPPGLLTSYCNSGAIIGGHIVETIVGSCWDDALRDRILAPAGLENTVSLPWEAILRPVAIGHQHDATGRPAVSPKWSWPRSWSPAGGTLAASAPDVLAFARLHLTGEAPIGSEIAQSMAEFQRPWPQGLIPQLTGMGLGWFLYDWGETRILGHDGGAMGGIAALRVIPDYQAAVVLLVNSDYGGSLLYEEVVPAVLQDELGLPAMDREVAADVYPASRFLGAYRRLDAELEVVERTEGELVVRKRQQTLDVQIPASVTEFQLIPDGADHFLGRMPQLGMDVPYHFVDTDGDGNCDYLYEFMGATRRT
jgi:CubicO group peptidase (beta-lactamase class C family)